jgi:hypothetical protein
LENDGDAFDYSWGWYVKYRYLEPCESFMRVPDWIDGRWGNFD